MMDIMSRCFAPGYASGHFNPGNPAQVARSAERGSVTRSSAASPIFVAERSMTAAYGRRRAFNILR